MNNAMASHIGDNPQEQSSTNEKAKDAMIVDMEGATHLQDLPIRTLCEKLKNVKQLSAEACLFKVHERLRKPNPEAYTPLTISIGPYHHTKPELRKMERLKELYTQSLLKGARVGVDEFWKKLKELEGRAENYYGDEIDEEVRGDEFVKMLFLDGCFIVEFVIRSYRRAIGREEQDENDPIYMMISGMGSNILRDMLLLENQLPFFVLQALYEMISNPLNPEFTVMVKIAFRNMIPKMNIISLLNTEVNHKEIKHLLQIVHILCQPQPQNNEQIQQQKAACSSTSCCFWKQPQSQGNDDDDDDLLCSIRTVSELQEAGIHFKKVGKISNDYNSNEIISLFDIKFNKHERVLEIPSFALYDPTETFFRNLIAYEQHSRDVSPMYFTDYSKFMDDLINTEKDVNLLRLRDVFVNGLGDDKEVTSLFNNLSKGVVYSSDDFYYKDVCKELNRHCKKPRNVLMAKLRRNYFHSPWAGISTFAAILLLTLAIAQTVLTALDLLK